MVVVVGNLSSWEEKDVKEMETAIREACIPRGQQSRIVGRLRKTITCHDLKIMKDYGDLESTFEPL